MYALSHAKLLLASSSCWQRAPNVAIDCVKRRKHSPSVRRCMAALRRLFLVFCGGWEESMSTVVLITGASTGFGRAAAETLARRGYTVFATMRDCSGGNAANRETLQSLASRERLALHVLDLDVTHEASVDEAIQDALSRAGRIDVVINNAGIAALGLTEAYTIEQFQQLFDVNVFGAVRVNRAVLPAMRRQR